MPNCKNGKIYSIRSSQTTNIYIGSTTTSLSNRMARHRFDYKQFLNDTKNYVSSFELLKYEDAYIELIEDCPCDNREQLNRREGEVIRATNNCINKQIAGRTRKQYCEDNKEHIKQRMKQYREDNKEKIKQYRANYLKNKSSQLDAEDDSSAEDVSLQRDSLSLG